MLHSVPWLMGQSGSPAILATRPALGVDQDPAAAVAHAAVAVDDAVVAAGFHLALDRAVGGLNHKETGRCPLSRKARGRGLGVGA